MIVWRSGLLAAWATAWLAGSGQPLDDVVHHVAGEERHRVFRPEADPVPLGWLLTDVRLAGDRRLFAVFPDSGDPAGIPPGEAALAAAHAGEAVVAPASGLVLVPSAADRVDVGPDVDVVWTAYPADVRIEYISPGEASLELAETVRNSTERLDRLDVPPWDPTAGRLAQRRLEDARSDVLPPGFPPRATDLLQRSSRLSSVLSVVDADPVGGAVTGWEARERLASLQPLRRAVRRALTAAYNAAPQ